MNKLDLFEYDITDYIQEDETEDLVYPEYQYRPEYAPSLIWQPSKGVLFRLIRAAYLG